MYRGYMMVTNERLEIIYSEYEEYMISLFADYKKALVENNGYNMVYNYGPKSFPEFLKFTCEMELLKFNDQLVDIDGIDNIEAAITKFQNETGFRLFDLLLWGETRTSLNLDESKLDLLHMVTVQCKEQETYRKVPIYTER